MAQLIFKSLRRSSRPNPRNTRRASKFFRSSASRLLTRSLSIINGGGKSFVIAEPETWVADRNNGKTPGLEIESDSPGLAHKSESHTGLRETLPVMAQVYHSG